MVIWNVHTVILHMATDDALYVHSVDLHNYISIPSAM